jgi:hypothetical protein
MEEEPEEEYGPEDWDRINADLLEDCQKTFEIIDRLRAKGGYDEEALNNLEKSTADLVGIVTRMKGQE